MLRQRKPVAPETHQPQTILESGEDLMRYDDNQAARNTDGSS